MSLPRLALRVRALTTRSLLRITILGFAFLGPLQLHAVAADTHPSNDPWLDVLNTRYTAASHKFEKLAKASPEDTRLTLSYAASLLARDPMTRNNVRKVRGILLNLISELPVSETHYRPLALLLLGRIDHDHSEPVQFESARAFYEQLRREYPQHPLADQAAVQLLHLIYLQSPESRSHEVVTQVEATLPTVSNKSHRLRLHELAARIYLRHLNDEASALPHLIAALEEGSEDKSVDLHIAYLARRLGRLELAAKHYRAFYESSPRDNRAYTSRRLAKELEEASKAAAALSPAPIEP